MVLTENSESFYFANRKVDDKWFRIFNYRMCSYTEFLQPSALESRGHTFEISEDGYAAIPIRLASHLFPKFFNYRENPFVMDLDLSKVVEIAHKMDGSLISTYLYDDNDLRLKTKGSLESDQAIAAMNWLNLPENKKFKLELLGAERLQCTVMMEWCSIENRIVLSYEEPKLTVLGIRNREDGSFVHFNDIDTDHFPEILNHWTLIEQINEPKDFLMSVPDMQGIEGFVCRMDDGLLFKLKCSAYVALHHTKDSINCPRRLFEAVLEEATDDMRSLFFDDVVALNMITDMELFVEKKYNHIVDSVERFYERNKELERKEYAILGQSELVGKEFGLAMKLFVGAKIDYKDFMKKNYKYFGVKDENDLPIDH
jgi:T4 RnlA family RNA ligase